MSEGWREHAACLPFPAEWWDPDTHTNGEKAKRICGDCPVSVECSRDALAWGEQYTIRAGVNLAVDDLAVT